MPPRLRNRQFPKREPHHSRLFSHQPRAASIERAKRTNDGKGAPSPVDPRRTSNVGGTDELGNSQEKERQNQEPQHQQNGNIGPQRRDEEDEREEAPGNEVDSKGYAVGALVAGVGVADAQ